MKAVHWIGIIILASACGRNDSFGDEQKLQSLLNQKEYFRLRSALSVIEEKISNDRKMYFRAFIDNAFNQLEESEKDIDGLFTNYASRMSDSTKAVLLRLQSNNYFRAFDYASAARKDKEILDQYSSVLDSGTIKDIQNEILFRKALVNISPQQITKTQSTILPWTRDKIGLIEIPIRCKDSLFQAIFDTRANISSISQTYAVKLGLKILDVSYEEGSGITGIQFKTGLGIADSLYLGNILVQHVIFQVMPDEILYLAPAQFSLNIILGFPVIEQIGEVHVFQDGRMTIPLHSSATGLNNLAIDKLDPIIFIRTGNGDTLGFYFDSGATSTDLFSTYYKKYQERIEREGKTDTLQNGGAGGVVKTKVYILDSLDMYIADKRTILKKVSVFTDPIPKMNEKFYGNIGQDFILQSKELIINFQDMYIDIKK